MDDRSNKTRASYDAVAEQYAAAFGGELDDKPLERALLDCFAELVRAGGGRVADVGCGPGHVTRYLRDRGVTVMGLDLSPRMIGVARSHHPDLDFRVGSMTALDEPDGTWAGAVVLYSIIHLSAEGRRAAYGELARVIRPGGWMLLAFHVSMVEQPPGSTKHLETWFNQSVDLMAHFLDATSVEREVRDAGFSVRARIDREPWSEREVATRRSYLLARRDAAI